MAMSRQGCSSPGSSKRLFWSHTLWISQFYAAVERLTKKVAMAEPIRKPAMTSDQWLRYSATRFKPVRNAKHMSPRDSTGLARRVPFTDSVHVTYICQRVHVLGPVHIPLWKHPEAPFRIKCYLFMVKQLHQPARV